MGRNLYQKVFDSHTVKQLSSGQFQVFIGLHLVHEVTSPQAFAHLRENELRVKYPHLTFATVDHIIPTATDQRARPLADPLAEEMFEALEQSTEAEGIRYLAPEKGEQGIVHVVGPELGLTQPGKTIACGDSHTSTHGAFGALAFGIGTSQVAEILATQTMRMAKLKVRRIEVSGTLKKGVYAKDVTLAIIKELGVKGGVGFAYEYGGSVIDAMSMEERMTLCNMSIEGGARIGYVNPDQTTFEYIKGREYAPKESDWEEAVAYWKSIASDRDAEYDDVVHIDGDRLEPQITWGITPGQAIDISQNMPLIDEVPAADRPSIVEAFEHMGFQAGEPLKGKKIDVVFIGSCTNSRISDLREVARLMEGKSVAPNIQAIVVPGSQRVQKQAESEGIDRILREAGFEWREAGCSMCLAMNPDKLQARQLCASTSNRNFKGRQGSPTGRTLLMSPAMAAAAAVEGVVADAREVFAL